MHQILPSPGKGLGLFATRLIPKDTKLPSDPYILHTPADLISNPIQLYAAVLALPPHQQTTYLSLAHTADPTKEYSYLQQAKTCNIPPHTIPAHLLEIAAKVSAIFDVNAFNLDSKGQSGAAVALQVARINHSCVPNAHQVWDAEGGRIDVDAKVDIQAGEEITITYVDLGRSREDRRSALRKCYDFECGCEACDAGI